MNQGIASKTAKLADLGRVLVVGLGVTGASVVRYLATRANVTGMADGRQEVPNLEVLTDLLPDAVVHLGDLDAVDCSEYDTVVLSPGVPRRSELVLKALELGLEVIGDIEVFSLVADAPVVAVTGSNGKSTVVHLLAEMAKHAGVNAGLGGNFGVPALDLLGKDAELYILELSSFQLESTVSLKPLASVVLNITPDHMDRYESVGEYAHTKATIYAHARTCVVNRDDPLAASLTPEKPDLSFGLNVPAKDLDYGIIEVKDERYLAQGQTPLMPVSRMKLVGKHNQLNALAALALGEIAGLSTVAMLETLAEYRGLEHRTQWVAEINNVVWLNDSKATNTGATLAALAGMDKPVVLIAGGQGKDADFVVLNSSVSARCREVILMGEDAKKIAQALPDAKKITFVENMEQAVAHAHKVAQAGDCVLLSPACASFDMYSGYAARGVDFAEKVRSLTEVTA